MVDDPPFPTSPDSGRGDGQVARQSVIQYLEEAGPIPAPSLQADLFPYRPGRFQRTLDCLLREGTVAASNGCVTLCPGAETVESVPKSTGADPSVTLRIATGWDFESLCSVVQSVAAETDHLATTAFAENLAGGGPIHRLAGDRRRFVYVSDIDGDLAGWGQLTMPVAEVGRGEASLVGGVAIGYRSDGIGSALLRYGLDLARQHGCRRVSQQVPAHDDDAFQFLRIHGFWVDGTARCPERPADSETADLRLVQEVPTDSG